jgi:ABC-2 type transport system ATP-binding protein
MLGMAMIGDPDLLVLDEPTTGLDPAGARMMREVVDDAVANGTTVFFSSHILEQVEAVADRVGILQNGRLVAVDTLDGLRATAGTTARVVIELEGVPDGLGAEVRAVEGVDSAVVADSSIEVSCRPAAKGPVVHRCVEWATVTDVVTSEASLEDLFARYTEGAT